MNKNRKILISLGIAGALALFAILTNIRWSCSQSPGPWSGEADEITIAKSGASLRLFKKGGAWKVGPGAYPADPALVDDLEKRLKDITVIDRISRKADYARYELDAGRAPAVTVKRGGEVLRSFHFGKKSSTDRHTFIRIDGKPGVYLAQGTFEIFLDKTAEDFRNREIVKMSRASVDLVEFSSGGQVFSFEKKLGPAGPAKKGEKVPSAVTTSWVCRERPALRVDAARLESYIAGFDPMNASGFSEKPADSLGAPTFTVRLRTGKNEIAVNLYAKEGDRFPVRSSSGPYVYLIDEYKAGRLVIKSAEEFQEKT